MRGSTVSILGCGWFGLPFGELLVSKGYQVKGSTTSVNKLETIKACGISPFLIDLLSDTDNDEFWEADRLIVTIPPRSSQEQTDQVIQRLQVKLGKHQYQQVLVISSTSVYPDSNGEVLEADASYHSLSRSGVSLLKYEDELYQASAGKGVILRFAGLYGPDRHPVRYLSGKQLTNGSAPVNLIHLEDCLAISSLLIEQEIVGERLNACHPHHPQKTQYYAAAARELGITPPSYNEGIGNWKIVSSKKLIDLLNYDFSESLRLT